MIMGKECIDNKQTILSLKNIAKSFGVTRALDGVDMEVQEGEIHAVLGQNGAGKSTLVNILDSTIPDFEGEVYFRGQSIPHRSMKPFFKEKLGVVHQEFPLIPHLSVAENIYLGDLPKSPAGNINWKSIYENTEKLFSDLGIDIDAKSIVKELSAGERQMVSIARALVKRPVILVFDEATSTLTDNEVSIVFSLLDELRSRGTGIIFISHKIEEILSLADRVTILRDGKSVATRKTNEISRTEMIRFMAGRDVSDQFPPREIYNGQTVLEIDDLSGTAFQHCSFSVKCGEVLGIAGLVGSGGPEMLKTIFGGIKATGGTILMDGQKATIKCPKDAMDKKIYFIPSDRRKECIFRELSIRDNLTIAMIRNYSKYGRINHNKEQKVTDEYIEKLQIKTTGREQLMKQLSGGNQQKVIISRWLSGNGRVFMFDEPTRGLDVGVKYDVYRLINQIKKDGGAVIMLSSELPELLALSDRIIVMYEGNIVAEMENDNLEQETVLAAMMNQTRHSCNC